MKSIDVSDYGWKAPKHDRYVFAGFLGLIAAAFVVFAIATCGESKEYSGVVVGKDFSASTHIGKFYRRERWFLIVKSDDGTTHRSRVTREEYESVPLGTLWNPSGTSGDD